MRLQTKLCAVLVFSFAVLTGCTVMRNAVVDHVAEFPASHLASDIKSTADQHKQEKRDASVAELSSEYEEFLRSQETEGTELEAVESFIVIDPANSRQPK